MNAVLRVTQNSVIDFKENEISKANSSKMTCSGGKYSSVGCVEHFNFQCLYRCCKKEQRVFTALIYSFLQNRMMQMRLFFFTHIKANKFSEIKTVSGV